MASPGSEQKGTVPKESLPETHCLVCFFHYDVLIRKPKVLTCQHVFCAVCLQLLGKTDEGCWLVSCPLCRTPTLVSQGSVCDLLDQEELFELIRDRAPAEPEDFPELLLTPRLLTLNQAATTPIGNTEESSRDAEGNNHNNDEDDGREVGVKRLSVLLVVFLVTLILMLKVMNNVFLVWGLALLAVLCYMIFFILCCMSRKRRGILPLNQTLNQTSITVIY